MEHALVRGDVRMLDDPLRAQSLSLFAGCVLAVIAVAACAILAFLQPRGALGAAPIVMVRDSGALYVRVGDAIHPVYNLASARLIAGSPGEPELVSASAVDAARRGPVMGIPGAPTAVLRPLDGDESDWTVCEDATAATTVIVGEARGRMDPPQNVLVTPRGESAATTYLLYDGRKARVDLRNHAVVRALRLEGRVPRPVSRVLLDALPEVPEIIAPAITAAGTRSILRGFGVGTVMRLTRTDSAEYYVALVEGVQRIGEVAADLITFTQPHGRDIVGVAPGVIGDVPIVEDLPVATFPESGGVADRPVVCTRWSNSSGAVDTAVLVGNSLPIDRAGAAVELAQADGPGAGIDNVSLPPGRSGYVRAAGVTGEGAATGALYLVNDAGVAFGVHDEDAAKRLGLLNPAVPAPWPVLARLPRGPELSVQGASIVRDSVGPAS
jgi:type VII secretion protein EccB